jgi:hypothetical protein
MRWLLLICAIWFDGGGLRPEPKPKPKPRQVRVYRQPKLYHKVTDTYRIEDLRALGMFKVEQKVHENPTVHRVVGHIFVGNRYEWHQEDWCYCECAADFCECGGCWWQERPESEWTCRYSKLPVDGGAKGECLGLDEAIQHILQGTGHE